MTGRILILLALLLPVPAMADVTPIPIPALPPVNLPLLGPEQIPIWQGNTRQITALQFAISLAALLPPAVLIEDTSTSVFAALANALNGTGALVGSVNPKILINPTGSTVSPPPNQADIDSRVSMSVTDFGAKCDGVVATGYTNFDAGGTMTLHSTALVSNMAIFSLASVGKAVMVSGAGTSGAALVTIISAYTDPQHVTLALQSSTAVSGVPFAFGTDDSTVDQAAIAWAEASPLSRTLLVPPSCVSTVATTLLVTAEIEIAGNQVKFWDYDPQNGPAVPTSGFAWLGASGGTGPLQIQPIAGASNPAVSHPILRNLALWAGASANSALDISGTNQPELDHVIVYEGLVASLYVHGGAYSLGGYCGVQGGFFNAITAINLLTFGFPIEELTTSTCNPSFNTWDNISTLSDSNNGWQMAGADNETVGTFRPYCITGCSGLYGVNFTSGEGSPTNDISIAHYSSALAIYNDTGTYNDTAILDGGNGTSVPVGPGLAGLTWYENGAVHNLVSRSIWTTTLSGNGPYYQANDTGTGLGFQIGMDTSTNRTIDLDINPDGSSYTNVMKLATGGLQIGAPTGGAEGAGTLNSSGGYYVNGVAVATAANSVASVGNYSGDSTLTITGTGSGPWTGPVTVKCTVATSAQIGCGEPDNVTIKATAGSWAVQYPTSGDLMISAGNGAVPTAYGGTSSAGTVLTGLSAAGVGSTVAYTSADTASTLVNRDASGNFSAGTITAALTGHASLDLALSSLGTGVATALGDNVGSAGAIVVNGGALGTPSSGTATNLTGTASGLTAGAVTTNANLTGDITSVGNATTDVKIATTASTTNASFYPVIAPADTTGSQAVVTDAGFSENPSTHAVTATTFIGALTGHASSDCALAGSCTMTGSIFSKGATTSPAGITTGFGTNGTIWSQNSTTTGSVVLVGLTDNYNSSFISTAIIQHASADTGITAGQANAGLGVLEFFNTPGVIVTNGSSSALVLGTNGTAVITISGTGASTVAGALNLTGIGADTGDTDATLCHVASGGAVVTGTGTLGVCLGTSSERYKTDLADMGPMLAEIDAVDFKTFRYKPGLGYDPAKVYGGPTAEGLSVLTSKYSDLKRLVGYDESGLPNTVDLMGFVPRIGKALQEEHAEQSQRFADIVSACRAAVNDNFCQELLKRERER